MTEDRYLGVRSLLETPIMDDRKWAKLPGIPGIEDFQGHSLHTSRWDYAYTGGGPEAPMDKLRGGAAGLHGRRPRRQRASHRGREGQWRASVRVDVGVDLQ